MHYQSFFVISHEHYNFESFIRIDYLVDEKSFLHSGQDIPSLIISYKKAPLDNVSEQDESFYPLYSKKQYYYQHGLLYRKNGPAFSEISENIEAHNYYEKVITCDPKNLISTESLSFLHEILSNQKGMVLSLSFLQNNLSHRDGAPSLTRKSKNQEILVYHKDGKMHREDGPAIITLNDKAEVTGSIWYLDGEIVK